MSKLYFVFDTEAEAIAAEAQISIIGNAPVLGRNAATGKIETEKGKTLRWAIPQQRLDGKWVFPYMGDERLAQFPQDTIDGFNSVFNYVFEEYQSDWFPVEEK